MKKFILLFFSIAVLTACSSDDDNSTPGEDPIVGTWVLVDASTPLDDQFCFDKESIITFNENNTAEAGFYLQATECSINNSQGTWSNNGNSSYTITVPVAGSLQGTASFTSNRFIFTTTFFGVPGILTFESK